MSKSKICIASLASLALAVGGCGVLPDILIDELKTQARTAAEAVVQNTIERLVEDQLAALLGEGGLPPLGFDLEDGLIPDVGTDGEADTDQ